MEQYPKIGSRLLLASKEDLSDGVFDCLKTIPCDRFDFRRAKEETLKRTHPIYWIGTECQIAFSEQPCPELQDAFERFRSRMEPYLHTVKWLIRFHHLEARIRFRVVVEERYFVFPVLEVTDEMMRYAADLGAMIDFLFDVDDPESQE